jgi:hypothetical protein
MQQISDDRIIQALRNRGVDPTPDLIARTRQQVQDRMATSQTAGAIRQADPSRGAGAYDAFLRSQGGMGMGRQAPAEQGGGFVDIVQAGFAEGLGRSFRAIDYFTGMDQEPGGVVEEAQKYFEGVAASPENQPRAGEEDTFSTNLARTIGNLGAFAIPSVVGGAVGTLVAPGVGTIAGLSAGTIGAGVAASATGGAIEYVSAYDEVLKSTGDEDLATSAGLWAGLGGLTEGVDAMIPVIGKMGKILARADKATGGGIIQGIANFGAKRMASTVAKGAAFNFAQEVGQETYSDAVVRYFEGNPMDAQELRKSLAQYSWSIGVPSLLVGGAFGALDAQLQKAEDRRLFRQFSEERSEGRVERKDLKGVAAADMAPGEEGPVSFVPTDEVFRRTNEDLAAKGDAGITREVEAPAELAYLADIGEKRGSRVRFVETAEGSRFRGVYDPKTGDILLNVNRADDAIDFTFGHELGGHALKRIGGEGFAAFRARIKAVDPEGLAAAEEMARERQPDIAADADIVAEEGQSYYLEEVLGPWMRSLAKNPDGAALLRDIAVDDRSTFRKIGEVVLDLFNDLGASFNTRRQKLKNLLGVPDLIGSEIQASRGLSQDRAAQLALDLHGLMEGMDAGTYNREARQRRADEFRSRRAAERASAEAAAQERRRRGAARAESEQIRLQGIAQQEKEEAARRLEEVAQQERDYNRYQDTLRRYEAERQTRLEPARRAFEESRAERAAAEEERRAQRAARSQKTIQELADERRVAQLGSVEAQRAEINRLRDPNQRRVPKLEGKGTRLESKKNVTQRIADADRLEPIVMRNEREELARREAAAAEQARADEAAAAEQARAAEERNLAEQRRARAEGRAEYERPFSEQESREATVREVLDPLRRELDAALVELEQFGPNPRGQRANQVKARVAAARRALTEANRRYGVPEQTIAPRIGEQVTVKGQTGTVVDVSGPRGSQRVDVDFGAGNVAPFSDIPASYFGGAAGLPSQTRIGGRRGVYDLRNVSRVSQTVPPLERTAEQRRALVEQEGTRPPRFSLGRVTPEQDRAYLSAVNAGDMATAQRMVDEAAKRAGYTEKAYHGSPNQGINSFNVQRSAVGFYFSPDINTADYYAAGDNGRVYPVFINMGKAVDLTDELERSRAFSEAFSTEKNARDENAVRSFAVRLYREGYGKNDAVTKFFDSQDGIAEVLSGDYRIEELLSDNIIEQEEIDRLVSSIGTDKVRDQYEKQAPSSDPDVDEVMDAYGTQDFYLNYQDDLMYWARNNYDSVVMDDPSSSGESVSYVVFDNRRIKSADPVTRDEQGNVVPLSQRFRDNTSDIRFSLGRTRQPWESPENGRWGIGTGKPAASILEAYDYAVDDRSHGDEFLGDAALKVAGDMFGPDGVDYLNGKLRIDIETKKQWNSRVAEFEWRADQQSKKDRDAFEAGDSGARFSLGQQAQRQSPSYSLSSFSSALDDIRKNGGVATQSFRTKFVDYLNETKNLLEAAVKAPYQKIEAMQRTLGRRGISTTRLRDEVTPRFNKIVNEMRASKVEHADVADFMRARVQPIADKIIKERRSLMDPTMTMYEAQISAKEAADIMSRLKSQPNYADIVRIVKMVDDVNQRALEINLASGKIDRDLHDRMVAQYDPAKQGLANPEGFKSFYGSLESMPERSVIDDTLMDMPGIGRGAGRTGRPYSGRTGVRVGAEVDLKSPVVNAFVALQNAVIRGVKSEEQRAYADLVKSVSDPTFAVIHETLPTKAVLGSDGYVHSVPDADWAEQEGWLPYIENGKWKAIEFKGANKLIAEDLKAKTISSPIRGLSEVTRKVASLMTRLDPTFMLRNIPRDWGWAFLAGTSKYGTGFTKSMASEYKTALKDLWAVKRGGRPTGLLKQYYDTGAEISSMGFKSYEDNLADLEKALDLKDPNLASKIKNTWESWVGETNDILENATRYAAFRAAIRQGKTPGEAALVAKEGVALNFEQTGRYGRPINSAFAFFNAGVNGTDAIIRMLTSDSTEGQRARRLAASVVAMGLAAELLNRMVSEDGDDEVPLYDNISDFEKNRNFLFMRPDGTYLKVPLPFGFNAVYAFGRNIAAVLSGARSATAAAMDSVSFATESASPFGSGPMLQVVSPTLLDPLVQYLSNQTFTGSKIAPDLDQFGRELKAPHEIFWKDTASIPKEVAEIMAAATEKGDSGRGYIDFRPDMMEHWLSAYTGGVGRAALDVGETIGAFYSGTLPDARETFAVRHFIGASSPFAIDKRYRDVRGELQQAEARYKQLIEEGDRPTALRWRAANAELFRASGTLKMIERALDKIPNTPENEERRRAIKARLVRVTGYTQE